jgi:multidrug efflux pump subunit AcrB
MINVSSWSIKNPIPAVMLFVMLCFAGMVSFGSMKVQNFPDIDLPTISVTASLPGTAPAQMETEVARKIENAIASLQGLKHITTKVQDGSTTISAEFRLEKPIQEALDDVRSAVNRIRSELPGDLKDPVISKLDLAGQPILAYTVRSPSMDTEALSWFVDNQIARKLLAVRGVGAVNRVGGVERQIHIALDPQRLQALGASAADISRQLKQMQSDSSGGRTDVAGGEQAVRTLGSVTDAQSLARMSVTLADGRRLRLDQVATISDTVVEPRSAALLNGQPVVGFEVSRSRGASEIEVGAAVQKALTDLRAAHPDIELTEAFDFVSPVAEEYQGSLHLLYEGAILAVIVVWLFLRDWRATLVTAVALPLSVIPAFIGMQALGFSINVVTLLALSLVVGILVDDAIVEVENIVRHLRMGKTPYKAAMEAADEIGLAVIATTFTLIAVFLPTAFMAGVPGKFFKQFGWTASLAVFASLVVARALTPMMAAYLLRPIVHAETRPAWMGGYLRLAQWCLKHRWWTVLGALAFFIGSLSLVPLLPTGFIPPDDNSQTQVYLELPPGTKLAQTQASAEAARQLLSQVPHIQSIYTTIGGGAAGADPFDPSGASEPRKATLTLLMSERGQRPKKQVIEQQIRQALTALPGVRSKVGLGGSGEKYILVLTGENREALLSSAQAIERELRLIPGLGNVASSASLVRPEVVVVPDFAAAADLGVTSAAMGETLRMATSGDYDAGLAKLNLDQRQIPIVVKLQDSARQDLDTLGRLSVPGKRGPVMLAQVAQISMGSGPAVIDRYDRSRNIKFEIELSGLPLGEVTDQVKNLAAVKNLPPGIAVVEVGDAEAMGELFASFGLAMLTGVLCIYIVLVLLFKGFLHPLTILAALPLSLGGAFVGLLLANKSFSMPSLIGLIMLMGIATKNSILLVEYAIVAQRDQGMGRWEALIDACHKRARPIIMTTIAMGAGMLPLALGWGLADPSFRSPMSIAVIGGLITSTVLSLLVIPVIYSLLEGMRLGVGARWRKLRGAA